MKILFVRCVAKWLGNSSYLTVGTAVVESYVSSVSQTLILGCGAHVSRTSRRSHDHGMLSSTAVGQSTWWNISECVATERNIGGRLISAVGGPVIGAVGGNCIRVLSPG